MAPHNGLMHGTDYDDIKGSNVELIGSDIDHRVKYASAATEPAWNNGIVGVQPGLFVWRIEDFQVVPVPSANIGVFYDGDSYIVLHSYKIGKQGDRQLGHEIYFWLGTHTSQDEAGTAAYKTVELDEFLKGTASQHRELQASPSRGFLELFPQRITIRRGGVATGFTHVEETVEERAKTARKTMLLRIFKQPGARLDGGIVVHEVEPVPSSLDDGDVFVLDAAGSNAIYVWQGRNCSPMEKAKAADVAQDLVMPAHTDGVQVLAQDEGRANIVVRLLEEAAGTSGSATEAEPSYRAARPVAPRQTVGNEPKKTLWRLSDESGRLSFTPEREGGAFSLEDLDSNDVFLLDDAGRMVWVWEGLSASVTERAQWLQTAQAYVQHLGAQSGHRELPPMGKVREGYESPAFMWALQQQMQ
ncbi:hypothetical protein SEUCBS139899_010610 [Sporothrix eucalyptigena]|uniref:Gelsolin-like domain-containing protein n=1 Tax=Sporothrix eucalyptigena TaxID=1812306 RepID=A0ABP0CWT8_9PEZI